MKRYKKYMTPYLSAFIIGPLLMLTEVFGEIMLPKLMSLIINNGVAERDIHYIMTIGAIMALTTSVMAVGGIGGAYFSAKASICFTSDLREDLFAKVQEFSFKNIDTYSTGSLVTRLTNDIQQIQNVIMMGLRLMLRAPGMFVGALIMAFIMNARLAVVILVVIPLLSLAIALILRTAFPRFTRMQEKLDRLNSGIQPERHEDCHSNHARDDAGHEHHHPGCGVVWGKYHHCRGHACGKPDCIYHLYRADPHVADDALHGIPPEFQGHGKLKACK